MAQLLEWDAGEFPDKDTWETARNMIAIELYDEGKTPDEAKDVLVGWSRRTRRLNRNEERNRIVQFVDWLYARPQVAMISCSRKATMAQTGWCVGAGCEFRKEQRKARNAQRSGPFNLTLWRRWQAHLIREYRNGAYVAATYDVLRDLWLERDLVDGQPVYIGCRKLAELVRRRVDHTLRSWQGEKHRMAALRAAHVLEDEGLVEIVERGERGTKGFRRANGYRLLPMPPAPETEEATASVQGVDALVPKLMCHTSRQ